jgi:RNA polymerase sigma-70 factor, ECF subfamily
MSGPPNPDLQRQLIAAVPNLRAFAISLCRDVDRADDLVQETLIKAWKSLSSFSEGTNFKAWLFTILRNTFLSERRKAKREVQDSDGELAGRLSVQGGQLGHMDLQDFKKALATLSDDQKEALILVGAEGFSYEEVAEICGCAVGTIKSRVNRARVRLSELLSIEGAADYGQELATGSVSAMPFRA